MSEENKPADSYLKNFGMIIPTSCTPIKKYPKYFGWSCISMKKWVGIRYYKRIVPVRADRIFDFLFWKFVKPIKPKPGTFETITYITIADLEKISNQHKLEAAMITGKLHWQIVYKTMHESKAAAYDFVVRKLKRTFNLTNNGKETNT